MLSKISSALVAAFAVLVASSAQATDLTLSKEALDEDENSIVVLAPLGQVNYLIRVTDSNEGVQGVDVVVTDNVPSLINIESIESDFGNCDRNGQLVTCDLAGLADGATVNIFITGTLSGVAALDQEIINSATVTAANEIQPSDNSDSVSFLVESETVVDDESGGCSLQPLRARSGLWKSMRSLLQISGL